MKSYRFLLPLLLIAALVTTDSCRPRGTRNTRNRQRQMQQQQPTTSGPSVAQVMSRADSALAKVNALTAPSLDVATVKPEDYPQSPSASAGYVPRPDLSGYSNYQAALAAYNGGQYDQSIALMSKIATAGSPPELVPNAYYWIGECYYAEGRYADAIQYFEYTVQVGPAFKREMAIYKLCRSNYDIGNTQAASMWLDRLHAEYPSSRYIRSLRKLGVQ